MSVVWDLPTSSSYVFTDKTSEYSSTLEISSLNEKHVGIYTCHLNDSTSKNAIKLEISKDEDRFLIDWYSSIVAPVTLDIIEPLSNDPNHVNGFIKDFDTEVYIDCQSSAGWLTYAGLWSDSS